MKNLLCTFMMITLLSSIYAQDSTIVQKDLSKLSEVRKFNNQIDLDVKNFFKGLSTATLIYKHKIESGKFIMVDEIKLLRVMATINTQINFTPDPTRDPNNDIPVGFHPSNEFSFSLGFGLEKQKRSKKFVHYYGMDLIGEYYKNDDDFSNGSIAGVTLNATTTTDRKLKIWQAGLNPLFGVKYYFSPRLGIGVESGILIAYFNSNIEEFDEKSKEFLDPVISKGIIAKFNNLRFLNISYAF